MKPSPSERLSKLTRTVPFWIVVGFVAALFIGWLVLRGGDDPESLTLSEFEVALADGSVVDATVKDRSSEVFGELASGVEYSVTFPDEYADELTDKLLAAGVDTETDNQEPSVWSSLLTDFLPTLLIVGVFLWFAMQMMNGGKTKSLAQMRGRKNLDAPEVNFDDVAGADEAVEELIEIRDFLEEPERFVGVGARIPRGVLLVGPPGTGKTLLAKAVAGEAGVPFFTISGSDFVEMFVGVGAARVRDLFKQARAAAPAIVFVDEIDAVGRRRGAGVGGGHDEREQTLNQLLVEMDGFEAATGVILMAATNRPDILDPALLRPGRFDRQVVVDAPDARGRTAILEVHSRHTPMSADVDLEVLARRTPGFTGADLANVVNEAALLAGRRHLDEIGTAEVAEAVDRVTAGPERRSRVMSERERSLTAVHEAGHALVAHRCEHADPVHKVSIVSRGRALGWTLTLPTEDRSTHSRRELVDRLAMLMGGRVAEDIVFGEITTGAVDDIERATEMATAMVTEFGMSDILGPRRLRGRDEEPFMGRDASAPGNEHSAEIARAVDQEVAALLEAAESTARTLITDARERLDALSAALIEFETLEEDDVTRILGTRGPAS